jgi:catechol 2,3-dioxygenase-like lactoylglutathione lyase family enzyme
VVTRVHTVAIPVADQERALAFYQQTLGFELRRDTVFGAGMRWVEVGPPGAQTTVALPPFHPGVKPGVDTGLRLATADARSAHAALAAAGVDVDELLDYPGAPLMFFFRDPDGNTLVLVQDD